MLILMLLLTCGWQTGYFFFVALRRIRCGHIALTTRGIHLSDHATDTHIPWEAARLGLAHDPLYVLVTLIGPGATSTARVPRPWAIIDDRRRNDLHHARKRRTVVFARIDRRRFCIAPELLDAILDHYLRNPDARAELADPEALARRVDALRSFPAGARWRGYGPVSVPVLEPV